MQNLAVLAFAVVIHFSVSVPHPAPFEGRCLVGEQALYPPAASRALRTAVIDLDKPPEERWVELVQKHTDGIKQLISVATNLSNAFFHGKLIQWVDNHMGNWDDKLRSPYREELKGIATATGIPLGELVLYNLFFELSSVCTAILGQDLQGRLFHARNSDFGTFVGWDPVAHDWQIPEQIRKLQTHATFVRSGKPVYEAVVFPGFVGTFSSFKKDRFTLTLNARYDIRGGYLGIFQWLIGKPGIRFTSQISREIMETVDSYDEAKKVLTTVNFTAPAYFLLGGNKTNENQGCLIVRSLGKTLKVQELASSPTKWYILQTNYDPWKDPLYLDDRRGPGNACMQKLGQYEMNFAGLFQVLSSKPNINLSTMFVHLMQVNSASETYVQKCNQPCWFV